MHIRQLLFLTICFLLLLGQGFGQTGNRDQYLTFKDSLTVFRDGDRLHIHHIIAPGQTLYGLSRFYGLELEELLYYNPSFKHRLPGVNDTLQVPIPRKALLPHWYPDFARWKGAPVFYTVRKGETLYQISRRTFGIPVENVMAHNPHIDENIQPGEVLFMGWLSTKGIPDSIRQFTGHPLWGKSHRLRSHYMSLRKTIPEKAEQGYGSRISSEVPGDELVVLHDASPVNGVVALKNPLNNRIVFARVIGPIPPGTYPPGTIVVASDVVGRMLGVKDQRFFVRLKYLLL